MAYKGFVEELVILSQEEWCKAEFIQAMLEWFEICGEPSWRQNKTVHKL